MAAFWPPAPNRCGPKKAGIPRSESAAAQARAGSSSPPRTTTSKRLARTCPGRSLFWCRDTASTASPVPARPAGSGSRATGKESHWVVTASRSFRPAYPASRSGTESARASSRRTSRVVRPRFSICR